jgi:hypothetical protein
MRKYPETKIGDTFGKLTVLKIYLKYNGKRNNTFLLCKCNCGVIKEYPRSNIVRKHTKSCGCINKERLKIKPIRITHNLSKTKLFKIWKGMRKRCNNKKDKNYHNYGFRGIKVCDEWNQFINFYNWSIENGYQENLSIDRINNNGNYEPLNCRWTNNIIQGNNKSNNHLITLFNETKTLSEWIRDDRTKIDNPVTFCTRLSRGWNKNDALLIPPIKNKDNNNRHKSK